MATKSANNPASAEPFDPFKIFETTYFTLIDGQPSKNITINKRSVQVGGDLIKNPNLVSSSLNVKWSQSDGNASSADLTLFYFPTPPARAPPGYVFGAQFKGYIWKGDVQPSKPNAYGRAMYYPALPDTPLSDYDGTYLVCTNPESKEAHTLVVAESTVTFDGRARKGIWKCEYQTFVSKGDSGVFTLAFYTSSVEGVLTLNFAGIYPTNDATTVIFGPKVPSSQLKSPSPLSPAKNLPPIPPPEVTMPFAASLLTYVFLGKAIGDVPILVSQYVTMGMKIRKWWKEKRGKGQEQQEREAREREQEVEQQREQEAEQQREQEAEQQREQEAEQQWEQEAEQQREQEAEQQWEQEAEQQRELEQQQQQRELEQQQQELEQQQQQQREREQQQQDQEQGEGDSDYADQELGENYLDELFDSE